MKPTSITIALLLFATPAFGQSQTIPAGYDSTPGGQSFNHWGSTAGRTMQVMDRSNPTPRPLGELSFRRLANSGSASRTAGTLDAEVTVAQCPVALLDTHFDSNHKLNSKVVLKGKVNVPDWTMAQPNPAFDLTFKFSTRWVYTGQGALIWTIRYSNSTAPYRAMDRAFGAIQVRTNGTSLGTGCSGATGSLRLDNSGSYNKEFGMHLLLGATGAPANAPAWVLIDGKAQNLTVPGLCTKLQALPNVLLPLGNADGTGVLTKKYLNVPYMSSLQGGTIVTQLMFLDPSQTGLPFRLTGGSTGMMPTSANTQGTASAYAWASGATATTGISDWWFFTGAPVALAK